MIRIGILGAADIAKRRFLPALMKADEFEFAGVAAATAAERLAHKNENVAIDMSEDDSARLEKAKALTNDFGGKVYESYKELIEDESVDAIYLPLPPALHYYWGRKVLSSHKHLYMEKPFTTEFDKTAELINVAGIGDLAIFENYGFTYNDQMNLIGKLADERAGELRLIRGFFGFPKRSENDFRHVKSLGGGALLDCGGYTLKAAGFFLGDSMRVIAKTAVKMPGHDVDGWGTITAVNDAGLTALLAFGMDNQYKCELEVWGSIGTIHAPRIFTPPADFVPKISLTTRDGIEYFEAKPEDAFLHGIKRFANCIASADARKISYNEIMTQASLVRDSIAPY